MDARWSVDVYHQKLNKIVVLNAARLACFISVPKLVLCETRDNMQPALLINSLQS